MAQTIITAADEQAIKLYQQELFIQATQKSFFMGNLVGKGEMALKPIQILTNFEKQKGASLSFSLLGQKQMTPVMHYDTLSGREEKMDFLKDQLFIHIMRGGTNTGTLVEDQYMLWDLREKAKILEGQWWARVMDQLFFMYLSGARGINANYHFPLDFGKANPSDPIAPTGGFANNPLQAPDTNHLMFANQLAIDKTGVEATDTISLEMIDRLVSKAEMMMADTPSIQVQQLQTFEIEGRKHYILIMSPWSAYWLQQSTTNKDWKDIQLALITAEGRKAPIFQNEGYIGIYNNVILYKHPGVIRFNDYGASGAVLAERCLFLGAQAAVIGFGSLNGSSNAGAKESAARINWTEELSDHGFKRAVGTYSVFGLKKTRFSKSGSPADGQDFGVMCLDVACKRPY